MNDSVVKRILPVIIGMGLTIVLLAGLAYISHQRAQIEHLAAPALTIIDPQPDAQVDSPLVVHFTSAEPIELQPSGWGFANFHLHARVNGVEYMPAAAEIKQTADGYAWLLPYVARGPVEIRLGWADQVHRELSTGASDTVRATLR